MTHAEKELRNQQIAELRKQGFSQSELAEQFGLTVSGIGTICKRYGVAGVMSNRRGAKAKDFYHQNQYSIGIFDKDEYARSIVEERQPDFEYLGGYTNSDGIIRLRCKECGSEFDRTFQSVRKGKAIRCVNCKKQKEQLDAFEREKARINKEIEKAKKHSEQLQKKLHTCPVCGNIAISRKYCCVECRNKATNYNRDIRRRTKIKNAIIDKDITLKALYDRDNGICYICGEICSWKDKETKDNVVICGDNYPSIDHVIPLVAGGKHSWDNVRLAHRICNSKKRDHTINYIPLVVNQ